MPACTREGCGRTVTAGNAAYGQGRPYCSPDHLQRAMTVNGVDAPCRNCGRPIAAVSPGGIGSDGLPTLNNGVSFTDGSAHYCSLGCMYQHRGRATQLAADTQWHQIDGMARRSGNDTFRYLFDTTSEIGRLNRALDEIAMVGTATREPSRGWCQWCRQVREDSRLVRLSSERGEVPICGSCLEHMPVCEREGCGTICTDRVHNVFTESEPRSERTTPTEVAGRWCQRCVSGHTGADGRRVAGACVGCRHIFTLECMDSNSRCPTCSELARLRAVQPGDPSVTWDPGPDVRCNNKAEVGSSRRYGVELELSHCPGYQDLRGQTPFGCKNDGTHGVQKEFVSPILRGDTGFRRVKEFCEHARANRWEVSERCGYHLHIDLTDTTEGKCKSVALAYMCTYDIFGRMVHKRRAENHFCCAHQGWDYAKIMTSELRDMVVGLTNGGQTRYYWANWLSYQKHKTVEIRLHSGTLNYTKITNWVKLHLRFVDWAAEQNSWDLWKMLHGRPAWGTISEILAKDKVWDEELIDYVRARCAHFGRPLVAGDQGKKLKKGETEVDSNVEVLCAESSVE